MITTDVLGEQRPWGKFEKFVENKKCTVKLLYLNPYSQTSLQYHKNRDEWWKILDGSMTVIVDNIKYKLQQNDTVFVKRRIIHQMITSDKKAVVLEISTGDFDENDIVRLKDVYNRIR